MELNKVLENLQEQLRSKKEEADFYTAKAEEAKTQLHKILGAIELTQGLIKEQEESKKKPEKPKLMDKIQKVLKPKETKESKE